MVKVLIYVILLALITPLGVVASDGGIPDTLKIVGDTLVIGQSRPIGIAITNDFSIRAIQIGLMTRAVDSGYAIFDSAVFVGRMADPDVLGLRVANSQSNSTTYPDSIKFAAVSVTNTHLPEGEGVVCELYFTGMEPGRMEIDSHHVSPGEAFDLIDANGLPSYEPQFTKKEILIIDGTPLPVISFSDSLKQTGVNSQVTFTVAGTSSEGFDVQLALLDLTGYDEPMSPQTSPSFNNANPGNFSWIPSVQDIGIWKAVFQACDSEMNCIEKEIVIEVVQNSANLLSLSEIRDEIVLQSRELSCEDLNNDGFSEIELLGERPANDPRTIYFYSINNLDSSLVTEANVNSNYNLRGLNFGHLNDDEYVDFMFLEANVNQSFVLMAHTRTGEFVYSLAEEQPNYGYYTKQNLLYELNNDQYLDYVSIELNNIIVNWGSATSFWNSQTLLSIGTDSLLSINASDFNNDGYNDLAIGGKLGLYILLNNQSNGFTQDYFYPLNYGTADIEITNQGADFNNDNLYDICLSVPSVGGEYSDLVVFTGNADGSFNSSTVLTVTGQIFGNTVNDFNLDGELDIAFVNGTKKYFSIIYGDGTGSFSDEVRYFTNVNVPKLIESKDIDLDGDVDIILATSNYINEPNYLFRFYNNLNPTNMFRSSMQMETRNNVEVVLKTPSGKELNKVKNTISGSSLKNRNIDNNEYIDNQINMFMIEEGVYTLTTVPKPGLPVGESFSISFTLEGEPFSLADSVVMSEDGYKFNFTTGSASPIIPRPGQYIQNATPYFIWEETGQNNFQLANDIDFTSLILDTVLSGNQFGLSVNLNVADTTQYFWRTKPVSAPEYNLVNVFNLVPGATGGNCCAGIRGNVDNDPADIITIIDLVFYVNFMFGGGPIPVCSEEADVDADSLLNIGDLVYLVDYMFGSPSGPVPLNCP